MSGGGTTLATPSGGFSPSTMLARIKTVDGTGSGLDADLLDGLHASSFVLATSAGWGNLRVAKTATFTVVAGDRGTTFDCTTGTYDAALTAAATLGAGFVFGVYNSGTGVITINPNASETIRSPAGSATTLALSQGQGVLVMCDGTGFDVVASTGTPATWITGTLPIANGGTNSSTALSGSTIMVSNGTGVIQGSAGTTTTVLHGNASGLPTYGAVSLTADISGILPTTAGGTGVNNAGTITNANNTTITGGGTVALGGFALTVPATGTAAMLAEANAFTNSNTITTAGGPTAILALSSSSGNANFSVNAPTGQLGQWKWNINNATVYTAVASAATWRLFDTPNAFYWMTYTAGPSTSATFTFEMTTDASAVGTAALISLGGLGVAKRSFLGTIGSTFKGNVLAGVQDATADTAGAVGEVTQGTNQTTYTNFTTTNTYQQLAVLTSLAPGRYKIVARATYYGNGATVAALADATFAISTTTASAAGAVEGRSLGYITQQVTSSVHETITLDTDINISAATSYYFNGKANFTVGNPQWVASITAYRLR